jgi:hypothetical protein
MKKEPMEEADLDREAWLGPMLRTVAADDI